VAWHAGRTWAWAAIALAAAAALAAEPAGAAVGDGRGGVRLRSVGTFEDPVYVEQAPGSRRLLFVVELAGRVRVLRERRRGGYEDLGTFLDARRDLRSGGMYGLFSIAFPPDYPDSGLLYAFLTNRAGEIVVREFRRRSARRAADSSGRDVIVIPHPDFGDHFGGQLQFGPDGLLYVSTGDGGGIGDPNENAQSLDSLLGKVLRISPRPGNAGAYGVPADNPFVGAPGRDEIYSYGLRNPWRFSFDGRRIAIGDVGQSRREEIDYLPLGEAAGANFGWDAFEGTTRYGPDGSPAPEDHVRPIAQYGHGGDRCAITGGHVVRDRRLRSLRGRYVYADFCTGEIRSLVPRPNGGSRDRPLGIVRPGIVSFGEGHRGRSFLASAFGGRVWRLAGR
jgi:glucose/arabinose dehydrogenase